MIFWGISSRWKLTYKCPVCYPQNTPQEGTPLYIIKTLQKEKQQPCCRHHRQHKHGVRSNTTTSFVQIWEAHPATNISALQFWHNMRKSVDTGWATVDPDKQTASQHLENVSHARNHCTYLACPTHANYYGRGGGWCIFKGIGRGWLSIARACLFIYLDQLNYCRTARLLFLLKTRGRANQTDCKRR